MLHSIAVAVFFSPVNADSSVMSIITHLFACVCVCAIMILKAILMCTLSVDTEMWNFQIGQRRQKKTKEKETIAYNFSIR